jgi:hypothetical protein
MLPAIAFANKNPEQDSVFGKLHGICLTRKDEKGRCPTEPHGDQATGERKKAIQSRSQPVAIANQVERLQTKRRKRCVTAADSDHDKFSQPWTNEKRAVGIDESGEETDDKAAAYIDDQSAERKSFAEALRDQA